MKPTTQRNICKYRSDVSFESAFKVHFTLVSKVYFIVQASLLDCYIKQVIVKTAVVDMGENKTSARQLTSNQLGNKSRTCWLIYRPPTKT